MPSERAAHHKPHHRHGREGDQNANMQARAGQRCERLFVRKIARFWKIEPTGVTPWAAHQIIQNEQRDVGQHQRREDFVGAKLHLQEGRNTAIERATDHSEDQHCRQRCPTGPFWKQDRGNGTENRAHGELPLGADVPDVGAVTDRQTQCDEDKGPAFSSSS
jgi:hypothetical protein